MTKFRIGARVRVIPNTTMPNHYDGVVGYTGVISDYNDDEILLENPDGTEEYHTLIEVALDRPFKTNSKHPQTYTSMDFIAPELEVIDDDNL